MFEICIDNVHLPIYVTVANNILLLFGLNKMFLKQHCCIHV